MAVSTLACHDVTRSASDLPGTYVLETIDNQLLPVQAGGVESDCQIIGGALTLNATGGYVLTDTLGCPPGHQPVGSVASQTGNYTVVGNVLELQSDTLRGYSFPYASTVFGTTNAAYSFEAIALDPTRYYGDTIARRRVYIRVRNANEPDAGTN